MSNKVNIETRNTARVFFLVDAILLSFLIIPCLWMWPMYSCYKKTMSDSYQHIALGVCSIIFGYIFGIVAGILMLCSGGKEQTLSNKGDK